MNVEVKVVVEVVVGGGEVVVEVVIEVIIMKNKKYLRVHQVEMPKPPVPFTPSSPTDENKSWETVAWFGERSMR